jgi:hypothetical protein
MLEIEMARKNAILNAITKIASFLENEDRPKSLDLDVTDLSTFGATKEPVSYTRKALRAFAKAVLVERQGFNEGLKALEGVNVKTLKDRELGALFALRTVKPSGAIVSKFYTTIRRMVKNGIMAAALAEQESSEPTESKTTRKPSKKAKKAKTVKVAKKPSKKAKKAEPKDTMVSFSGTAVTIPTVEFKLPRSDWNTRAQAIGVSTNGKMTKKELIVRTVTMESIFA